MCRICLFEGVTDHEFLADTLSKYETSMGGDGNGYVNTHTKETFKGLGVSTDMIAMLAAEEPGVQIFHTRFATYGGSNSKLNHPFNCGDYGYLVHNGSWSDWLKYEESDYTESDTECAALLVSIYGPGVLRSSALAGSGVWVLYGYDGTDKILVSHRGQHQIALYQLDSLVGDGGWMIASEAPAGGLRNVRKTVTMESHHAYVFDPSAEDGVGDFVKVDVEATQLKVDPQKEKALRTSRWSNYNNYGWGDDYGHYDSATKYDDTDYGVTAKPTSSTSNKYTEKEPSKGWTSTDGETWYDGQGGKWVPCKECQSYDYVAEHIRASEWLCEDCAKWDEEYQAKYPEYARKYAEEISKRGENQGGLPFGDEQPSKTTNGEEIDEGALMAATGMTVEELMNS